MVMDKNILVTRSSMPPFEEYCEEIKGLWETRWLTNMGVKHEEFRRALVAYLGCPHVIPFANGHLALENTLAAMRFPAGGEVITTPFTFASTTHAIVRNGLVPVFCDIREDDYTLDAGKIEELVCVRPPPKPPAPATPSDPFRSGTSRCSGRYLQERKVGKQP